MPSPEIDKIFKLGVSEDFYFNLVYVTPRDSDTLVGRTLPIFCADACLPGPDHRDQLSLLAGSFKRIAAPPPIPKRQLHINIREVRRFSKRKIFPRFTPLEEEDILDPLSWINQVNQSETRKAELREVYMKLQSHNIYPEVTGDEREEPTTTGSFCKDEKYNDLKAPRWINASQDEVKVIYGPIADAIMKHMCSKPYFIKKVPVAERADAIFDLLFEENSKYVMNDYTSFEAHFDRIRMSIWHDFILYMCSRIRLGRLVDKFKLKEMLEGLLGPGMLDAFLNEILMARRTCKMRGFGDVSVIARRMSGEMDTSAGNGFSNFVMTQFVGWKLTNHKQDEFPCVIEGDDSLTRYPPDVEVTDAFMAKYGWHAKIETHVNLSEASFCGLIFDPQDKISVCDVREAVLKLWTNRRYVTASDACLKSLLRAKALSFACEYGRVPIIGPLAYRILELTKGVHVRKSIINSLEQYERERLLHAIEWHKTFKPWQVRKPIPINTRELVQKLYGIDIEDQLNIEQRFLSYSLGPFSIPEIDFSAVTRMSMLRYTGFDRERERTFNYNGRSRLIRNMKNLVYQLPDTVNFGCYCLRKQMMLEQLDRLIDPREVSQKQIIKIKRYKNFRRSYKRTRMDLTAYLIRL